MVYPLLTVPAQVAAISGCSVHTEGLSGQLQAPQSSNAECHSVGLRLSAAVTRGLQASFRRIIYTKIYISCLAGERHGAASAPWKNKTFKNAALAASVHPNCGMFLRDFGF